MKLTKEQVRRAIMLDSGDIRYMTDAHCTFEPRSNSQRNAYHLGKEEAFRRTLSGTPGRWRILYDRDKDQLAELAGRSAGVNIAKAWARAVSPTPESAP